MHADTAYDTMEIVYAHVTFTAQTTDRAKKKRRRK